MSHLFSGLVLCVLLISGFVQANETSAVGNNPFNYCLSFRGKCQPACEVKSEIELWKLHVLCGRELRCCVGRPIQPAGDPLVKPSNRNGTHISASSSLKMFSATSAPLSVRHSPDTTPRHSRMLGSTKSSPTARRVLSLNFKKADTKIDTSFIYNNKPKSKGCGVAVLSRVRRIVGGTQAERCLFPWMVYISRDPGKDDLCGGTLVSDRHVITAAHCYDYLGTNWPALYIGEYNRQEGNSNSKFVTSSYNISIHPYYSRLTFSYDIAILTLHSPIPLDNYECLYPICLPERNHAVKVGDICTVAGWGSISRSTSGPAASSPSLMKTEISVLNDSACKDKFGNLFNGRSQICAGDLTGRTDSCVGDSGGPLMCSMTQSKDTSSSSVPPQFLMGVISSGATPCAQTGTPALYTDIQEVRPWIKSILKF